MKSKLLLFTFLLSGWCLQAQYRNADNNHRGDGRHHHHDEGYYESDEKIQVALILDVSGSMEGLIDQAKSQLWYIVNGLSEGYRYGEMPELELALFEMGNSRLGYSRSYMRRVVPFTTDLDWISEELFHLRTGGSREYYGEAIDLAVSSLRWSNHPEDLKMIFVAGNENFSQGRVSYRRAIEHATREGISVNTIFCGSHREGRRFGWFDAAEIGGGEYMSIDHNSYIRYDGNQYDDQMIGLNTRLNNTYIPYGSDGHKHKQRQITQDRNAAKFGRAHQAERMIAKSSHSYRNTDWDLIDAVNAGKVDLATIPANQLPVEMRRMTTAQKRAFIARKKQDREAVRAEIRSISTKKKVVEKQKEVQAQKESNSIQSRPQPKTLDKAIIESTKKQQQKKVEVIKRKEVSELGSRTNQKSQTTVVKDKSKPTSIEIGNSGTKKSPAQTKKVMPNQPQRKIPGKSMYNRPVKQKSTSGMQRFRNY